MTTHIQFLGISAYRITADDRRVVMIDPFLDANPVSPLKVADLHRVDLLLVTHAAFDHLGDAEAIAKKTGAPVVCGGDVKAYLIARGCPGHRYGLWCGAWRCRSPAFAFDPLSPTTGHSSRCRMARSSPAFRWALFSMPSRECASIIMVTPRSSVI